MQFKLRQLFEAILWISLMLGFGRAYSFKLVPVLLIASLMIFVSDVGENKTRAETLLTALSIPGLLAFACLAAMGIAMLTPAI